MILILNLVEMYNRLCQGWQLMENLSPQTYATHRTERHVIRKLGLKVTNQRIAILEVLRSNRNHFTAQEVYEKVIGRYPMIGFATVYRFLRALSDHSFVTEVRMGGLPARYEWKTKEHHDHLTCQCCGKICEFEDSQIEKLQKEVAKKFGFTLTRHVLELYGLCPQCQKTHELPSHQDPLFRSTL